MGRFPSGQREQTVNLPSPTSVVRIHLFPPRSSMRKCGGFYFAFLVLNNEKHQAKKLGVFCVEIDDGFKLVFLSSDYLKLFIVVRIFLRIFL